MRHCKMFL